MKQASVLALLATVATASSIHGHRRMHVHEKREVVTRVETKYEPHVAVETVWVDSKGNPLGGGNKAAAPAPDSYGKKPAAPKPNGKKNNRKPHRKPAGDKEVKAEDYGSPPPPQPAHQPPKSPEQQSPEEIQQGYADAQESAIAAQQEKIKQQQEVNSKQPGVDIPAYQAPKDQPSPPKKPHEAPPKPAAPAPKPQPPKYQAPSSGGGGGKGMKDGKATFYTAGLGSCGQYNGQSDHIVALSTSLNADKSYCGKKLKIKGPGGEYTATVADTCGGCDANHLDLPEQFFNKVTNNNQAAGVVPISWSWL